MVNPGNNHNLWISLKAFVLGVFVFFIFGVVFALIARPFMNAGLLVIMFFPITVLVFIALGIISTIMADIYCYRKISVGSDKFIYTIFVSVITLGLNLIIFGRILLPLSRLAP